jgi:D-alanyl-D-alanine carboxypeptidase
MAVVATVALTAEPTQVERVQAALDAWLAARAPIEKITSIAAYISFGDAGPAIEAFAGKVGRDPDSRPVDQDTLYQMGSTSKSFTAAVILQLEAQGKLSLDNTLAKWLPEYPVWKDVTIRRLLNMTSGIPNYSETEWISKAWANEQMRAFTLKELVNAAYPSATNQLPATKGYHYSNTNYALAGMIAEKASGKSFRDLVHEMVIEPHGLDSTFYEASTYRPPVIKRLAHGYFENEGCADYQPDCKESWNAPILGRDMRNDSVSWMQSAGGGVANARDVDRWMRAIFSQRNVVVLLPGILDLLVAQHLQAPGRCAARTARQDHLVDVAALGGDERVGEALLILVDARLDLLGIAELGAIEDLGCALGAHHRDLGGRPGIVESPRMCFDDITS